MMENDPLELLMEIMNKIQLPFGLSYNLDVECEPELKIVFSYWKNPTNKLYIVSKHPVQFIFDLAKINMINIITIQFPK